MKNILVSIDFEKETGLLIDRAIELAKKFSSKIIIVHIAAPDPDFVGYEVGPQNVRDVRARELKEEHSMLESYVRQVKQKGIDAEGMLMEGVTVPSLLRTVKKLNIDFVVIGHHKRNYFYKAFVGNTDIALINQLNVPVLTVPLKNDYSTDPMIEPVHKETIRKITSMIKNEA